MGSAFVMAGRTSGIDCTESACAISARIMTTLISLSFRRDDTMPFHDEKLLERATNAADKQHRTIRCSEISAACDKAVRRANFLIVWYDFFVSVRFKVINVPNFLA